MVAENQKFQDQLKQAQEKYMVLLQSNEELNLFIIVLDLENRNFKLIQDINQLRENLVELSEKNTELISELEISQSNKARMHKVSFHSVEQGLIEFFLNNSNKLKK